MTDDLRSQFSPQSVAPVVTWLASADSADVTGQVIESSGLMLAVAEGWHRGPTTDPVGLPTQVGATVLRLLGEARVRTLFEEIV
jgi:hypothetical protein